MVENTTTKNLKKGVGEVVVNKKRPEFTYYVDDNGCWICTSHKIDYWGYPKIHHNGKSTSVHRHLYQTIYGNLPKDRVVRHTCDNPLCINPIHLLAGTHADNVADRVARHRSAIGSNHGRAKLTEKDVKRIKTEERDIGPTELAKKYDVDRRVIYQIRNNLNWNHV